MQYIHHIHVSQVISISTTSQIMNRFGCFHISWWNVLSHDKANFKALGGE